MRGIISIVAFVTAFLTLADSLGADAHIDKSTVEKGRVRIKGMIDTSHDLVLRIDRATATEWRTSGGEGVFDVTVEASDKISLDGGKTGHGFVMIITQGASNSVANVALTEGNPIVGTFTIRPEADVARKNGVLTFADVTLKDGKKVPVSLRLEAKKK